MKYSLTLLGLALSILYLTIMAPAQIVSQQSPYANPSSGAYQAPAANTNLTGPQGTGNATAAGSGNQNWPQYQYPQHNNPFYDGGTPGGMVSDTIDWLVALPSNLMDRFSEFMDTRFFPQKPATSGAQGSQSGAANQPPAPLPPANAYDPNGR